MTKVISPNDWSDCGQCLFVSSGQDLTRRPPLTVLIGSLTVFIGFQKLFTFF